MRKKDSTRPRRPYRPQLRGRHRDVYYLIARTLHAHVDPDRGHFAPVINDADAARVVTYIQALCDLAGVECGRNLAKSYDDAMKAVYMRERAGEKDFNPKDADKYVDKITTILQPIEDEVERKRRVWHSTNASGSDDAHAAAPRGKAAARKRGGERLVTIAIKNESGVGSCGFVYGEVVEAVRADDLRPGEIAAIGRRATGKYSVARVASIGDSLITILCDGGDAEECSLPHTFLISELEFLGRVNPEPIGRWDGPTEEECKKIKEARRRLEKLGDEDDQIIRGTERYRLEKIIFDILHPVGGDLDDWGAWEEGGEG